MRSSRVLLVAALVSAAVPATTIRGQDSRVAASAALFTNEQLDNLVAPVALYPDAILAQVLIAATFPEQIDIAARWVRAHGTRDIDSQNWDVSVKAVAHYPPVLNMLADRDDWTTALGQAYAEQSTDVMESVQHLREMARAQGNLESTSQQRVIVDDRAIRIVPAEPRVIYVPTYDPEIVFYRPVVYVGVRSGFWSFGVGFPIGSWLSYDCDWYGRRVYYDGWRGGGWRVASYPYIVVNTVYVHPRYEVVYVNRNVWHRSVNYGTFNRYNTVHRTVNWNDRRYGGSPGPLPRGVANNNGRRDDGRADGGRYDGRNDVGRNDGRRDDGRSDVGRGDRSAQGRNDAQNQNRGPARDNNERDNNGRDNTGRDNNSRGGDAARATTRVQVPSRPVFRAPEPVQARPPVTRGRPETQPPRAEQQRRETPVVESPRISKPRVESRAPTVERRSAPPAAERRSPPSKGGSERTAKKR